MTIQWGGVHVFACFTPADAAPVKISTDYVLSGKTNAIFKVLRFKGTREHLIKRVNDVIYTFQQAVVHGFTSKELCFVLADEPSENMKDLDEPLRGYGTIVNILDSNAKSKLMNSLS